MRPRKHLTKQLLEEMTLLHTGGNNLSLMTSHWKKWGQKTVAQYL